MDRSFHLSNSWSTAYGIGQGDEKQVTFDFNNPHLTGGKKEHGDVRSCCATKLLCDVGCWHCCNPRSRSFSLCVVFSSNPSKSSRVSVVSVTHGFDHNAHSEGKKHNPRSRLEALRLLARAFG